MGELPLEQPGRVWPGRKGPGPRVPPPPRPAPTLPAACLGSDPSCLGALVSQPAARAGLGQLCPPRAHPRAFAPWLSLPGRRSPHLDLPGKAPSPPSGQSPLSHLVTVPSPCSVSPKHLFIYLCGVICCPSPQWNVSSQEPGSLCLCTHSVRLRAWPTVGAR